MIVPMHKCDNPRCNSIAHPGDSFTTDIPPDGWIMATAGYIAQGNVKLVVCKSACLKAAFDAAIERGEQDY